MCAGAPISRTEYDLDGYLSKAGQVTGCGEIRLRASALRGVFGREELQLRTDEGQLLRLHFSEKRLSPDVGAAHVDLVGDLPAAADWRRSSERRPLARLGADPFLGRSPVQTTVIVAFKHRRTLRRAALRPTPC